MFPCKNLIVFGGEFYYNLGPMNMNNQFDVIIVGGGHAGTEAALASARMGARTLLLSHNIETLGQMSCNPAIGGIGKGHLVKEIDALGGAMARAADLAGIHFKTLNARKGPAVRATRVQADRVLYKKAIRSMLENQKNLTLFQQAVDDLIIEGDTVKGVLTQMGLKFYAHSVVLTVGTFLGGKIHIGLSNYQGGRAGDPPSIALAHRLRELPFHVRRLKTGTPPRIDGRTINYAELEIQAGDDPRPVFSSQSTRADHPLQTVCHITRTNKITHEIIAKGLDESPMYTGVIEGVGPRYCPSIEDKIHRFADKDSHQIFIEPEGLETHEVYPNGISTSLSFETQYAFVRSIKGFENAHITRPGYAIEYDFFDPQDLQYSLETKFIKGLFFAGQINGTTGYEEAGAQGLIAGLNAALRVKGEAPYTPRRDEAYMGVLIDDLISRGTLEPYRMFTSRAEYRLSLREDNADLRLTDKGRALGLVPDAHYALFEKKRHAIDAEKLRFKKVWVQPESEKGKAFTALTGETLLHEYNLEDLLKRPQISYAMLMSIDELGPGVADPLVAEQVETHIKYAGYVDRQQHDIAKQLQQDDTRLSSKINYAHVRGLSNELREKLIRAQPETVAHAKRLSGMTPAAISLLLIHLKKHTQSTVA